ncbi:hypothetical protein ACK301_04285 [Aeromonas caviae]
MTTPFCGQLSGEYHLHTVRAVIATKTSLKDTEVLKLLILKGIQTITEEDYEDYVKKKKAK